MDYRFRRSIGEGWSVGGKRQHRQARALGDAGRGGSLQGRHVSASPTPSWKQSCCSGVSGCRQVSEATRWWSVATEPAVISTAAFGLHHLHGPRAHVRVAPDAPTSSDGEGVARRSTDRIVRPTFSRYSTTTPLRSSSDSGYAISSPSRTSTNTLPITRLRYHLRSEGTTYHGADAVEVLLSTAS